jgi:acetyl-CoA carboxylase carboxyltransferase component
MDESQGSIESRIQAAIAAAGRGGEPSRLGSKLPVRRRLELLLDPGSLVEDGLLANSVEPGHEADGVVTGTAKIGGRPIAVIAHDPAVKAGSWGLRTVEKQVRILELADGDLLPVFYLVDSAGGRLTDQLGFFAGRRGAARIFHLQVRLSGRVPQLCVLFGPAAAGGAYMPAFCDWIGMVDGNASMSLASSRVAKVVVGEDVSLEEMGGARMHTTVSGTGDQLFGDEETAIVALQRLFDYLPQSYLDRPTPVAGAEPAESDWADMIPENPRTSYDVRAVIDRLVDRSSFFEVKASWAAEIVVGLGRMDGRVVGVVANQPRVKGGAIFVDSADKAARFISWCDAFNIPLVFLTDVPGFMVGSAVERQGIIRHGAKLIMAMASAQVPRFCVVLRKAYAAGYYAMSSPGFEPRATIALPSAQIGAMSAEAAVRAVFARKIDGIDDPDDRARYLEDRNREYSRDLDLLRLASDLYVDAVVPGELVRQELIRRLDAASGWRRGPLSRHHNVSPA